MRDTRTGIRATPAPRLERHHARFARIRVSAKKSPLLSSAGTRWASLSRARSSAAPVHRWRRPLTLNSGIDDDPPEQGSVCVQFYRGSPNYLATVCRDDHCRDEPVDAVERTPPALEESELTKRPLEMSPIFRRYRNTGQCLGGSVEDPCTSGSSERATW